MDNLKVGPLEVAFHRTVRVSLDKTNALPPSLGRFPIHKVSDYRQTTPAYWEDDAVFIALHDTEAMWMSFNRRHAAPVAVLVGCGGINALNGEKLGTKLVSDNYLVAPPQPWLDGWKGEDGTVCQFIGTEYQKGTGLTVGEQIMGAESRTGGLGIAVFEAKDPSRFPAEPVPEEWSYGGEKLLSTSGHSMCIGDSGDELCGDINYAKVPHFGEASYLTKQQPQQYFNSTPTRLTMKREVTVKEMGVGKGGKITQKIYPDPHGIETWKEEPAAALAVYLVDSQTFSEITGLPMPPLPVAAAQYHGKWFGLHDEHKSDLPGTSKFTGLKTCFNEVAEVVQSEPATEVK